MKKATFKTKVFNLGPTYRFRGQSMTNNMMGAWHQAGMNDAEVVVENLDLIYKL